MKRNGLLQEAREAYRASKWKAACDAYADAHTIKSLEPQDLADYSKAAYILGRKSEFTCPLTRAHQLFVERGDRIHAVQTAFWLGFTSMLAGELARAGGWLSRADRLLQDCEECVERGYLLAADGFRSVQEGKFKEAQVTFRKAVEAGIRFGDKDLMALALNGQGRALILLGEVSRGVALLDEAMVAVASGEVSPLMTGGVYCSVIDACTHIMDLRRAGEWTSALDRWCASQPDTVFYYGYCMIRRVEILQFHGHWSEAFEEAYRAQQYFSEPTPKRPLGGAFYQI